MTTTNGKTHLAHVFHWSAEAEIESAEILAAGLGMAGPVLLAALSGHLSLGLMAALGALAVSGAEWGRNAVAQAKGVALAIAPAALACVVAGLIGGRGWLTSAMLVLLACVAATVGGYSRPLAVAATRFVLFLAIAGNLMVSASGSEASRTAGFFLLFLAGAFWAGALGLLFGAVARLHRRAVPATEAVPHVATARQKFTRWKRSLAHLAGWQYTIRLGLSLGIAEGLLWLWPAHHFHWIALTVAILTARQLEAVPVKTTQRAFGTTLGVVAAALFFTVELPLWGLILAIGVLAGLRPLLKARNYLAYSAIMTPLVMLLMDGGQPPGQGVLLDRLVATVVGAVLVIAANLLLRKALPETSEQGTARHR